MILSYQRATLWLCVGMILLAFYATWNTTILSQPLGIYTIVNTTFHATWDIQSWEFIILLPLAVHTLYTPQVYCPTCPQVETRRQTPVCLLFYSQLWRKALMFVSPVHGHLWSTMCLPCPKDNLDNLVLTSPYTCRDMDCPLLWATENQWSFPTPAGKWIAPTRKQYGQLSRQ